MMNPSRDDYTLRVSEALSGMGRQKPLTRGEFYKALFARESGIGPHDCAVQLSEDEIERNSNSWFVCFAPDHKYAGLFAVLNGASTQDDARALAKRVTCNEFRWVMPMGTVGKALASGLVHTDLAVIAFSYGVDLE